MILKSFRVQMYKGVIDSGQIALSDLTCLVGKNEAGKTSILEALYKLNPYSPHPYVMNKEWPRGQRKDWNADFCPCSAIFELEKGELDELAGKYSWDPRWTELLVCRTYEGKLSVAVHEIGEIRGLLPPVLKAAWEAKRASNSVAVDVSEEKTAEQAEAEAVAQIEAEIELKIKSVEKDLVGLVPTMIYMDDYKAFSGNCNLIELKQHVDSNKMSNADETVLMILQLSGLDINEEVKKIDGGASDQRQYDLADASATLTRHIDGRWKQRKYEVELRADGPHFHTFVKDNKDASLIPLEERSKGFQWFFSFDLMLMHESQGTFKNCVILLDEPGLHLHPEAQRDLLKRLEKYAEGNRLVYSTHLPFMIDLMRPERIRIISETPEGARVSEDLTGAQPEAKFVLQAALGMSGACSYSLAKRNLVVEGVDDYWIVSSISRLLEKCGEEGLPDDVMITPSGGASEVAYIATLMLGQELDVVALLDSDGAGEGAAGRLIKKWITRYPAGRAEVLLLGEVLDMESASIEDIFSEDEYLEFVRETYNRELAARGIEKIQLPQGGKLVGRVEEFFKANGMVFNHGSVALRIKSKLSKAADFSGFSPEFKERSSKLLDRLAKSF